MKCLFIDRDGCINRNIKGEYVFKINDFFLVWGIEKILLNFQRAGYLIFIITNQGCISKGLCTEKDVDILHFHMRKMLEEKGVHITKIYYCPHHTDNEICKCRKPGTELFEKAIKTYSIDVRKSYLIGDSQADIIAGIKLKIGHLHLINSNDIEPLFKIEPC
ncbi:MAG: HAD-IIIA family hydrolase [Bacteroidota bacterium]